MQQYADVCVSILICLDLCAYTNTHENTYVYVCLWLFTLECVCRNLLVEEIIKDKKKELSSK